MDIIKSLDKLFNAHPFLSVAFSGFGISLISLIILTYKIIKRQSLKKQSKQCTEDFSKISDTSSIQSTTANDINTIKSSLSSLFPFQEEIYVRYFNKYKKKLDPNDVTLLNEQYEHLRQTSIPNYSILLNKLIGLLEAIDE